MVWKITAVLGLAILAVVLWHFVARYRYEQHARSGSLTYGCSESSATYVFDPKTYRPVELQLTEARHPDRLGDWTVIWPGKPPIRTANFEAQTGSIGGSQGIKWREPDGRQMTAILSFSDLVSEYGTTSIQAEIDDPSVGASSHFDCRPDPTSWRA